MWCLLTVASVPRVIKFMNNILIYALLWLSFGFAHSLLTISTVKSRLAPALGSAYRLSYNIFALFHIGLVFLFGRMLLGGSRYNFLAALPVVAVQALVTLCGVVLMLMSLRQYDLGQFSGLSQIRSKSSDSDQSHSPAIALEPLNTKGLNSWVRHPLYSGVFLFLWGSAVSPFGFWTALFGSIYLVVGAHYEEQKLISEYGEAYVDYKARVPAFIPRWATA